jgi:hypothetical protein
MNRQEAQRSEHKAADEAGPPTSFLDLEREKLDDKTIRKPKRERFGKP